MINNELEYILCAAIMRKEPKNCNPYFANDITQIEIGYRHHDIIQRFKGELDVEEQGFYTSKGRYVDRKEALKIAKACGQVEEDHYHTLLFSEDLY